MGKSSLWPAGVSGRPGKNQGVNMTSAIPPQLQAIIDDFQACQGQEKLYYLLEMAEKLPPLPAHLQAQRDAMEQVHECMTPVFLHGEQQAGKMIYFFDVSPESPTVRGFASILMQGINGLTPEEVLRVPGEFYLQTGLQQVLSGQRLNGISTFLGYMKRLATPYLN